jgi:hypothetical protein
MKKVFVFLTFSLITTWASGQSRYDSLWSDPAVEQRIQQGIETHRKGEASITIISKKGKLPKNAKIEITQLTHEFQFGSNIFMLHGYPKPEQNKCYEEV